MRTCWIAHVFEYCCQKSVVLQNSPNALPRSWSVCVSYVQMSGVAPKQPHDAPKCGLDERNWVCGLKWSSYYSGSHEKRKSMCIIDTHWNTFILLPCAILNIEMRTPPDDKWHTCVCPERRWWSSSSSRLTCLSCRWRWMSTLLWRRYNVRMCVCKMCFCASLIRWTALWIDSRFILSLHQWMFLQLNPMWDGPIKQLLADADAWLCKRRTGTA